MRSRQSSLPLFYPARSPSKGQPGIFSLSYLLVILPSGQLRGRDGIIALIGRHVLRCRRYGLAWMAITTPFPNTGLANQLLQVAKLIKMSSTLKLNRQIFFCSIGGFDTHTIQLTNQATLLGQLSDAMHAFYNAPLSWEWLRK
jgi:hypothetical protein